MTSCFSLKYRLAMKPSVGQNYVKQIDYHNFIYLPSTFVLGGVKLNQIISRTSSSHAEPVPSSKRVYCLVFEAPQEQNADIAELFLAPSHRSFTSCRKPLLN